MMQGRWHWRPLHGKARAMACGGNPRALPDLMAAANAADPHIPSLQALNPFLNPSLSGRLALGSYY